MRELTGYLMRLKVGYVVDDKFMGMTFTIKGGLCVSYVSPVLCNVPLERTAESPRQDSKLFSAYIRKIMEITDSRSLDQVNGKAVRWKVEGNLLKDVGHLYKDIWLSDLETKEEKEHPNATNHSNDES